MVKLRKNKIDKRKVKLEKVCSTKIAFNFSYVSNKKDYSLDKIDKKYKLKLLDKMLMYSSQDKTQILCMDKYKGMELLEEKYCKCQVSDKFKTSGRNYLCGSKFYIFRIGNKKERVIGKFHGNIFYVLFIDIKGKAYNHGS